MVFKVPKWVYGKSNRFHLVKLFRKSWIRWILFWGGSIERKGPPGKPTAQMNLGAGLAQPRVQSMSLTFCSGILQFHSDGCEKQRFYLKNLALKSNLASPMIVLVFECPVFAVVNPEERPSNIQVCPNHLHQITLRCTLYTHIISLILSSIKVTMWFSNIKT